MDYEQRDLPLPEDKAEIDAAAARELEWRRAVWLDNSKRQMEDCLPGGKKHTGALFSGERPHGHWDGDTWRGE